MAQYEDDTVNVKVPSVAYRLTQPLKDLVKIIGTNELNKIYKTRSNGTSMVKIMDDFLEFLVTAGQLESKNRTNMHKSSKVF